MPTVDQLAAELSGKSESELMALVTGNYDLSNAVVQANPSMSQDAGFELFGVEWAKRYWRSVVTQVSGTANDKVYGWAVGASIAGVANQIIQYYGLSPIAFPAAVALAVILIRAARDSHKS